MDNGYIKLWRNLNKNEILANDNNALVVFIRLLTLVDRNTGSYITGRKKLAVFMNMNDRTLYGVLKRLERATMLQLNSNKNATTIYICNWHKWQQDGNSSATEAQMKRNTKQEEEKEKNNIYKLTKKEEQVLSVLNTQTKRKFRDIPKSAKLTMKKFSIDEIELALSRLVKDSWHVPRLEGFSSDYFLRSSTIDKFLSVESKSSKFTKSFGKVNEDKLNLSRKQLAELEYKNT